MGVGGQTMREVDAPAIEELAARRDRDEHRRVAVLGDTDGGSLVLSRSRYVVPPGSRDGHGHITTKAPVER
jgi:hypothetical protein